MSRPWVIEDRIVLAGKWTPWERWVGSTYATYEAAQRRVQEVLRRDAGAAGPTREIRIRHREDANYVLV